MSEINQPPTGTLDASPPKTTTQHSHTSDSGHESDSSEENEAQGNPIHMAEDELADDEETPGAGLHIAAGMNEPQGEGWGIEDMVVEEAAEGNLATNPDNSESQTKGRANVGEEHARTQTPTVADNPTIGVSLSSIGALCAEKLAILKQSQPLEYLKVMLNYRESSSDQSHNTSMSEDPPSSTSTGEILSKIKDKVFKGDLFLLLLADPSAPLTLKALLSHVNLLEASPEVANVILEIRTMIDQAVVDHKSLPHLMGEIEKKSGFEVATWDAATEYTNKSMESNRRNKRIKRKLMLMIVTLLPGDNKYQNCRPKSLMLKKTSNNCWNLMMLRWLKISHLEWSLLKKLDNLNLTSNSFAQKDLCAING